MRRGQQSDTDLALFRKVGCFSIGTYDPWKIKDERKGELAACARFVAPLVASAAHARLYPSKVFKRDPYRFLIPRKGFLEPQDKAAA